MNCIISIPQEAYDLIMGKTDAANLDLYSTLIQSVKNGTPLDNIVTDIKHCKNRNYGNHNEDFVDGLRTAFSQLLDVIDMHTKKEETDDK